MNRLFPRAEDLNQEEIDYELAIRDQSAKVFELDLAGKQRHLRWLFKDDQKEGRNYRSKLNILDEASHIEGRIENLEKALERKVEPKFESRVLHYWYRTKRCTASNDEEKKIRRELSRRIEKIMQDYQFGPPLSPYKEHINNIIHGAEDGARSLGLETSLPRTGVQNEQNHVTPPQNISKGAIPKHFQDHQAEINNDSLVVSRKEWEEMQRKLSELMSVVESNPNGKIGALRGPRVGMPAFKQSVRQGQSTVVSSFYPARSSRWNSESEDSDVRDNVDRQPRRSPIQTRNRLSDTTQDSIDSYDSPTFLGNHRVRNRQHEHPRRNPGYGRVEKWKLRFTGESRSLPVENFVYKAKKLAEREGVSKQILFQDIHMLLEGIASDWFFTFVDDMDSWEDFERDLIFRFGNPNKDQGIRSKIQERKQQRGEPFIAFVTDIEKLNRMLSQPLSKRRKFEIVWDNMRQHYRSKISIVEVRDLQHLITLNHRIDAADSQLQFQMTEGPIRRHVNHIEAEDTEQDSDHSITINEIRRATIRTNNAPGVAQLPNQRNVNRTGICWNCQEQGHGWRQCTKPKLVFCYGCGSLGRTIRNCERCVNSPHSSNQLQGNA